MTDNGQPQPRLTLEGEHVPCMFLLTMVMGSMEIARDQLRMIAQHEPALVLENVLQQLLKYRETYVKKHGKTPAGLAAPKLAEVMKFNKP